MCPKGTNVTEIECQSCECRWRCNKAQVWYDVTLWKPSGKPSPMSSANRILTQSWFTAGPASETLARQWTSSVFSGCEPALCIFFYDAFVRQIVIFSIVPIPDCWLGKCPQLPWITQRDSCQQVQPTRHWTNVGVMLGRRRRANIEPILV